MFQGWTTYSVGVAKRARVEVIRQPARSRVVVAVRADFATVDRQVFFLDRDRFVANEEPFFASRMRRVPVGSTVTVAGEIAPTLRQFDSVD